MIYLKKIDLLQLYYYIYKLIVIMDITVEPEIYCPMIDEKGNYIDMCPAYIKYGIRCPCGAREDWVYDTKSKFKQHILCVKHKKWIEQMNNNKLNFISHTFIMELVDIEICSYQCEFQVGICTICQPYLLICSCNNPNRHTCT